MSRRPLIPAAAMHRYRPGTVIVTSRDDLYFLAAALSDDADDVWLSERKYADQGKAHDFAEAWFERNAP